MTWISEALATGLAATTFLVAFSSIRLRGERDRALVRSDAVVAELSRATATGRAVSDAEVMAAGQALQEADRLDPIGSLTVYVSYLTAGMMAVLGLIAGLRSGLRFSLNPFEWSEATYAVAFFLVTEAAIVILGARDYRWVGDDLNRRLAESTVSKAARAIELQRRGENAEALQLVDGVVQHLPSWPWAHAFRSHTLARLGRTADALTAVNRAISLDPANQWWLIARAEQLIADQRFQEALADIESLDAALLRNAKVLTLRGAALYGSGSRQSALEAFDLAITLDPADANGRMRRGTALLADIDAHGTSSQPSNALIDMLLDDGERVALEAISRVGRSKLQKRDATSAIEDFSVVLSQNPDDAAALAWRASAKLEIGDDDGAEQDYARALEAGGSPRFVHRLRGDALRRLGHLARAEEEYSAAIDSRATASSHYMRAMIRLRLGRYADALEDWNEVLELDPSDTDAMAHRAETIAWLGKREEADVAFEATLEAGGNRAHTYEVWLNTLLRSNRAAESAPVLERALSQEMNDSQRSRLLALGGSVFAARKLFRRALDAFDEAARLDQESAEIAYRRGLCLADMGEREAAVKSIDLATAQSGPLQYAAFASRSSLRRAIGDNEGALQDINSAVALEPEIVGLLVSRACLGMEMGDLEAAVHDLDRALTMSPRSRSARRHRMRARLSAGDVVGASEDLSALEAQLTDQDPLPLLYVRAEYWKASRDWPRVAEQYRLILAEEGRKAALLWELAAAYINASEFREAEEVFRLLVREFGASIEHRASLAVALSLQKRSAEAVRIFADLRTEDISAATKWVKTRLHRELLPDYDVVMGDWIASG
ncbi:tetratricopeptide repeat protein [Agromyces badenianii]|uniref:tetratricopeptide repeat protein n=1 Tax=Agromyces badenianii TaxID=2080742 RepID=UPI000D595B7C|nr:tetratricopeptide repeat protein [Agromyces badenianii]PWC03476.1 hypothetical protein DCE94_10550 [Agromyces badenianii]